MADTFDSGAPASVETPADFAPTALTIPVRINIRNADQRIDASGKASHLDGSGLVGVVSASVGEGTVLFTTLFLDSINTAARGLLRVRTAQAVGDHGDCEITGEWVDLNAESRAKIDKVLSGAGSYAGLQPVRGPIVQHYERHFDPQAYQLGLPHAGDMAASSSERSRYFEPAPYRAVGKPTTGTKFWNSIGVTGYIVVILIILAFFPVTRRIELQVFHSIVWGITRLFYWMTHINQVRLYNNT